MFENIVEVLGAEIWEILGRIAGVGLVLFVMVGLAIIVVLFPIFWRKFFYGQ
ncbi:hypothetical protein [Methanosarcina sp. KYL-1]|uniref:hypothetical protein n=1 Tax=Methanosarcina sp. KYL-1 TaxID=2602068 RepID=UPI0021014B6A|nr:hypothetical protein [Methanosarcina sp. KYL-1]